MKSRWSVTLLSGTLLIAGFAACGGTDDDPGSQSANVYATDIPEDDDTDDADDFCHESCSTLTALGEHDDHDACLDECDAAYETAGIEQCAGTDWRCLCHFVDCLTAV